MLDGSALADRNWGDRVVTHQPGPDTIQEFCVEDNSSSTRHTRPTTIVASTRSGANQLHGSLFETRRNNYIGKVRQRQDYYSSPPKLIRNEFGASAGGPVYIPKLYNGKNKTFWFFGYEGLRNINPATDQWPVPTQAMRNGDSSGLLDELTSFDPKNKAIVLGNHLRTMYTLGATLPSVVKQLITPRAKFETWQDAGTSQKLMTGTHRDWGPRLAFAYRLSEKAAAPILRAGYHIPYFAASQPDSRVQDWNITLEKEVMSNTVARLAYVGNHGSLLEQYYTYNDSPPDYIWFVTTGQRLPTGSTASVIRRPFDNVVYGSIQEYRKTGWSNWNGLQFELERRYHKGIQFQVFYVMGNSFVVGANCWSAGFITELNQYLSGAVPSDVDQRNRFLNYMRDTSIPKHRVNWNWLVNLPFGKGKPPAGNAPKLLDKIIGGWQVAGMGSLASTYFSLPTGIYPTGTPVQIYGYKYPIQDCTSGTCYPGYLWWNGYIAPNRINSVDAKGKPNGIMGVPADYKPAGQYLIPAGATTLPANAPASTNIVSYWNTNTVWIPLKDGTIQRTTYNPNLHPWRQQFLPSVRQWGLTASLFKTIPIGERVKVRFNADFFKVLNHPGNPNSVGSNGVLSVRNSGSGARELQLTARVSW